MFADDKFQFNNNGRKVSKRQLEKDILILEQFVLFPQCFQKTRNLLQMLKDQGLLRKGLTKQQNFRLDQIESICRQQNKLYSKIDVCY